ncbi:TIGR01841 family phasin [Rhodoferax sp. GW822-FHT02A01]|uniref:TIGR01841 family phasin n=1 Tax=Rhodoferax sp. GW822-FHT02A01 TaxID=3141537 RepID=UPI00315CD35D
MTTLNVEQILAANKTAVAEAQALAASAFAGFEKLVALNLAATKSALFDTADLTSVLSAKSPTDALAAQASLIKPLAEKSIAYGRSVYAIASETSAELTAAAEGKFAEAQKSATAALDNLAKNAPAGTESVVAVVKSAVAASQNALDTAKASAKKAVEVAEKQANAVTDNVLNAVKTNSRKK